LQVTKITLFTTRTLQGYLPRCW